MLRSLRREIRLTPGYQQFTPALQWTILAGVLTADWRDLLIISGRPRPLSLRQTTFIYLLRNLNFRPLILSRIINQILCLNISLQTLNIIIWRDGNFECKLHEVSHKILRSYLPCLLFTKTLIVFTYWPRGERKYFRQDLGGYWNFTSWTSISMCLE